MTAPADPVSRPLLIIGTHRSGTTFLASVIGRHPDIALAEEPRHIWAWGHNFNKDDVLTSRDATPRISRHIRKAFAKFLSQSGKPRLAEKTPSNCLRLPFIEAIYPDARYLHIYRDGRAVVRSTSEMNTRRPDFIWIARRLLGTAPWEWPAFIPRATRTLGRHLMGRKMTYWGPCPRGWKSWVDAGDPQPVILAKQWRYTIEPVLDFRDENQTKLNGRWMDLRYEDFMANPAERTRDILRFADLPEDETVIRYVTETVDPSRQEKWKKELQSGDLDNIRPILEPTLERLGYEW